MMTSTVLAMAALLGAAAEEKASTMPAELRAQIDEHMIGQWTVRATWGNNKIRGAETIRWSRGKLGLLIQGHARMGGKRTSFVVLVGWDGDQGALVDQGFNSDGETWTSRWTKFTKDKWMGHGSGIYQGIKWDSPATIEFGKDTMRYEDVTDGKPWVAEYTRRPQAKKLGQLPEQAVEALDYYVGEWTYEGKAGATVITGTWSVKWAPDKSCQLSRWSGVGPNGPASGNKITGWDTAKDQMVDLDFGSLGEHYLSRYTAVSAMLWEGTGVGSTPDGKPASCKYRLQQAPNEFTWTLTDRMEGGESQPDRVFVFRKKEK